MFSQKTAFSEIEKINNLLFEPSEFTLKNIKKDSESKEYAACTFQLNNFNIIFRRGKITPRKNGQFVTLWKRNDSGITAPFAFSDVFDFFMIAAETATNFGIFIFPKIILKEKKVLSHDSQTGKRGIRIYPVWEKTTSQQALKTQTWQTKYFVDLSNPQMTNFEKAKGFFRVTAESIYKIRF